MPRERLNSISLHQEMQRSYLEYAMSVIVGRALPDARDGLKPVQRRILFAMHELGLTPERPFKKCARVVGDVLGKYHPHGDQAVYDALVRLVQDFTCKYPVLDGHGNFGSIDDDPPAAMRYTETRLAQISHEGILKEIDSETVDFSPNFDGSQQEPTVLPAQLPFLILNGCSGIAVGMATSIPPHNLNEIVNGLLELIIDPELDEEKLFKIIPAPDFPTGGEILISNGIIETYRKGKGSIVMRGIAHIEEVNPGKGKHKRTGIVITELPYQVSKSGWIEKLAEQVNEGKINGIADIRDESDRNGMRILIEIRRDSNAEKILDELYRKTNLQCNFGATILALVNGKPIQLSLKKLLLNFLEFREETIIKRTNNSLKKILNRLEIIEALIKALKNLKQVIKMIEEANDPSEAKEKLIKGLALNNKQAEGVLSMPLRKLTGLEKQSLYNELKELETSKSELELILKDRKVLMKLMSKELKYMKKRFGSERKSKLIKGGDALIAERNATLRPNKELQRKQALEGLPKDGVLLIDKNNLLRIISKKAISKINLEEDLSLKLDVSHFKLIQTISDKVKIITITEKGKVGLLRWEFGNQKLTDINKFLPNGLEGEKIISLLPIVKDENHSIGLLTSDGRFKRLSVQEVLEMSNRSATVVKLKENVSVKSALLCKENEELIIGTNIGRILRININKENLPLMGKLSQGSVIINLFSGESLTNAICLNSKNSNELMIVSKNGLLFKKKLQSIRACKKGNLGTMVIDLTTKKLTNDKIKYIVDINQNIILSTNKKRDAKISKIIFERREEEKINLDSNEYIEDILEVKKDKNLG